VSTAAWSPTADASRLQELRHNLQVITTSATNDLKGLAREASEIHKRRKVIIAEDTRLRKRVVDESERRLIPYPKLLVVAHELNLVIARLQEVRLVADEIQSLSKELSSVYEATLDPLTPHVDKLITQYPQEYDRYRLDEIVVAAMAPIVSGSSHNSSRLLLTAPFQVRRSMAGWQPFEEPDLLLDNFRLWRRALKTTEPPKPPEAQVGFYGAATVTTSVPPPQVQAPMTPFESLLWNAWLPRVRSALNNDWDPCNPTPAVRLYELWSSFLPAFIRDNILDQLVLPKLTKAIADWRPSSSPSAPTLRALVFPWLPHVGLRLDSILSDALRRLKSVLRSWLATDPLPPDLAAWRTVISPVDWDTITLKYVVPKLGASLRDDFRVNPRQQDMGPLTRALAWTDLLRPAVIAQLLEKEFFPKWLDVLHIWLIQPRPSQSEIARWLEGWRDEVFPESVKALPAVRAGFTAAFDLVNKAIDLGSLAPAQLPKPTYGRLPSRAPTPANAAAARKPPSRVQEITFRTIAEEFAAAHNLLFVPTTRLHEKSRVPLIRVSPTADGRGGVLVYILDDAVWAPDSDAGGEYRAISLETMVVRAAGGKVG
jgi:tuftelin-interacting protein 11